MADRIYLTNLTETKQQGVSPPPKPKICFKQSQKQQSELQQPFLPRQKTTSQNDSDKLYVTLCRNIMFYFHIKHSSRFCDMHSFSPSFLVMGRVFPPIVFLISHASYLSLPCLPFWMTKKLCFPPTSQAYRHLSIHSQRSGGKEGSAWKKNMQFEELWQRTHFWSYLRCNLNNLSDPLPLISCQPREGEKVQWASQDVSACSSVDVENSRQGSQASSSNTVDVSFYKMGTLYE